MALYSAITDNYCPPWVGDVVGELIDQTANWSITDLYFVNLLYILLQFSICFFMYNCSLNLD